MIYINCPSTPSCNCYHTERLRHIPLFLEWDSSLLPLDDDPPIVPFNDILLAPRYYIKVYSPQNYNTDQSFSPNPFIYKIDRYGLLSNKLQLMLRPSIDKCMDSLYRVEYWYWRKVVNVTSLDDIDNRGDITHKFIKEEYWYIPDIPINIETVTLNRRDDDELNPNEDILPSLKIFAIKEVLSEGDWNDWTFRINTLKPYISLLTNERVVSYTSINWLRGPRLNTKYTLSYYIPLSFKHILPSPLSGKSLPPKYTHTFY